jgi:tetratricopeptide (TPR) repeat protein
MDKHYGKQPRLSKKQMRKRSDIDPDKYNQLVVADEQEVEHEYKSDYRGRVQNRKTEVALLPMYALTFIQPQNSVKVDTPFENSVDAFNQISGSRTIFLSCDQETVGESRMKHTFEYIDSLSTIIDQAKTTAKVAPLLLLRAVAYASIQNFDNAIDDLSICLQIDSTSSLAYWQRAVCQAKINEFNASEGTNVDLKSANVLGDLSDAIALSPQNSYLYYNRGNLYALRGDYQRAIADYSQALKLNQDLAEAWYNRGLSKIFAKHVEEGIEDLSKAGELGLYQAYSVIKKYREK